MKDYETTSFELAKRANPKGKKPKISKGEQMGPDPMRLPILTEVEQSEAKLLVPPGGSIWRDRMDGAWCSHFGEYRRYSASFKKHGQAQALRLNLVDLWSKWCLKHGVPRERCPLQGIFASDGTAEHTPRASGASSSSAAV